MLKSRVTVELDIFELGLLMGLMTHLHKDDNSIAIHMRHRFVDIMAAFYEEDAKQAARGALAQGGPG